MRATHPGWLPRYARHPAVRYPARSDRHPIYLFGYFDLDGIILDPYNGLNEAILGVREAAQPGRGGPSHAHSVHRPVAPMKDSGTFMFGTAADQPRAMPWEEQLFASRTPEAAE